MLSQETLNVINQNDNFKDKQLLIELTELLSTRPEAVEFLHLYGNYGELVDDLVDEPGNPKIVEEADKLSIQISQCAYWQKHQQHLWVVRWLVHNTYFDTVKWESASEEWKRRDAKALSHCGYMMLFAVILLEFGIDTLNKFSLRFREHAHLKHINDLI
jgi:G:T-mismatch repair DNA endonuclease (very short patch repair protein)